MQRFRAALLALGLVALLAGHRRRGSWPTQAVDARTTTWAWRAPPGSPPLDDYAERARAVTLLASHSGGLRQLLPGARQPDVPDRGPHRRARPDAAGPSRRSPTSRTCSPTASPRPASSTGPGPRTPGSSARAVIDARRAGRRPHRRGVLRPRLRAALRQGLPVGALPLGVDRRLGRGQRRQGQHRARRLAGDRALRGHPRELPAGRSTATTRPTRSASSTCSTAGSSSTRKHPQDVGAPLGQPGRPQPALGADRARRLDCVDPRRHAPRGPRTPGRDSNVATSWAVVVSTPARAGLVERRRSPPARSACSLGRLLLLALSMVGYVRHGRSMHRAARRDELTGLHNRRAARECAETMLARERGLAVILFDLDRFKHVNDSLGHHAGDHLLAVSASGWPRWCASRTTSWPGSAATSSSCWPAACTTRTAVRVALRAAHPGRQRAGHRRRHRGLGRRQHRHRARRPSTAPTTARCCSAPTSRCTTRRAAGPAGRSTATSSPAADRAGLVLDADLRRAVVDGELTVHYQPIFAIDARRADRGSRRWSAGSTRSAGC